MSLNQRRNTVADDDDDDWGSDDDWSDNESAPIPASNKSDMVYYYLLCDCLVNFGLLYRYCQYHHFKNQQQKMNHTFHQGLLLVSLKPLRAGSS